MEEGEGLEPSCLSTWPGFRNRLPPTRRHLPWVFICSDFLLLIYLARSTGIEPALPTRQAGVLAVTPQPYVFGGAFWNRTRWATTDSGVTARSRAVRVYHPAWWSRVSPSSAQARDTETRRRHRMVEPPGLEPGPRGCKPRTLPLRHGPTSVSRGSRAGHKKTRPCRVFIDPMGYGDTRLQEPLREPTAIRVTHRVWSVNHLI